MENDHVRQNHPRFLSLQPVPEPAPVYTTLRDKIIGLSPIEIGVVPSSGIPNAWGILMELGFPEAAVTLVSLADGTTSLYFNNGGGIIGSGEHEVVAQATRAFVAAAEEYRHDMLPADSFPLPHVGRVRYYILTFTGIFTAEADEGELAEARCFLSPLYCSGQEVITQLRLMQEQRRCKKI
jgi:hypothetical protein